MKPIEYLTLIFFDLMRNPTPNFITSSLWLSELILELDKDLKSKSGASIRQNDKFLDDLSEIEEKTHKDLNKYLALVEAIVTTYPKERWNDEYDGKNNSGNPLRLHGKNVKICDMDRLLKESYKTMVKSVGYVIKDYSLEYRISSETAGGMDWGNTKEKP